MDVIDKPESPISTASTTVDVPEDGSTKWVANPQPDYEIDPKVVRLLGPPPTLPDENPDDYWWFFAQHARDYVFRTTMYLMIFKDLVDTNWELLRFRRMKASIVQFGYATAAAAIPERTAHLAIGGDPSDGKQPSTGLSIADHSQNQMEVLVRLKDQDISHKAYVQQLDTMERFDDSIARAIKMRDYLIQQLRDEHSLPNVSVGQLDLIIERARREKLAGR